MQINYEITAVKKEQSFECKQKKTSKIIAEWAVYFYLSNSKSDMCNKLRDIWDIVWIIGADINFWKTIMNFLELAVNIFDTKQLSEKKNPLTFCIYFIELLVASVILLLSWFIIQQIYRILHFQHFCRKMWVSALLTRDNCCTIIVHKVKHYNFVEDRYLLSLISTAEMAKIFCVFKIYSVRE